MNLQGKTALVTGSTSGIGLGIAQTLANAGAQVILNGFGDVDAAINAVSRMGKTPGYHEADLSDESQIINMMAYARREFGGVDILVNNAGIQYVSPVESFPVENGTPLSLSISLLSFTPRVWHCQKCALVTGVGSLTLPLCMGW